MRLKNIQDTNFQDYCKTSMLIATCFCDGKCWRERGLDHSDCHNDALLAEPIIEEDDDALIERYLNNPLSQAIIFGGLEPMFQFDEILTFIKKFREKCDDDVLIYTGYTQGEIAVEIEALRQFPNIIVKFGRYIPDSKPHYDEVLGIELVSENQFAIKL